MANLPPFTPLYPQTPAAPAKQKAAVKRAPAKPKLAKPSVSSVESILGRSPIPLLHPGTAAAPHDPPAAHPRSALTPPSAAKPSPGSKVTSMQQFLKNKGYDISVDGVQGPLTSAAAQDWRTSRNPNAWNTAHGHITAPTAPVSPAAPTATDTAPVAPKKTKPAQRTPTAASAAPEQSLADQAKAIVDSILNPLLANVRTQSDARATAGQSAITGYTNNAVDQLKGIDFQAPYAQAAGGANAINEAELALLKGQGSDLASQVGAKLAAAGVDSTGAVGGINADTAGAAGANYATGGATTQELLSQGAAAGAYGKKLPGIEALAGLQSTKLFQSGVASDLSKNLGDITAQAPGLANSVLQNLQGAKSDREKNLIATVLATGWDPATQTLTPAARETLAKITGTSTGALSGSGSGTSAAASTKVDTGVSKLLGYVADSSGAPIVSQDGKIVPVDKAGNKGTPKLPSASDLNKFVDTWFDGKKTTQRTPVQNPDGSPVTDANGAPIYRTTDGEPSGRLDYGQAYKRLRALNVSDTQARQLLNTRYQRGIRGRAWLTNEEQTALKNAGLPAKATRYKSVAYLTRDQVSALQQAHKLPAGEWAGNHYVIAEGF